MYKLNAKWSGLEIQVWESSHTKANISKEMNRNSDRDKYVKK
jgi:hypothetical protein